MPKRKVALTLDAKLVHRVDELVSSQRFRNRSQAVEAALREKLQRLGRTRTGRRVCEAGPFSKSIVSPTRVSPLLVRRGPNTERRDSLG